MLRAYPTALLLLLSLALLLPVAPLGVALGEEPADAEGKGAEGKAGAQPPVPKMATDEEALEALAEFKIAFKARGLKGEEKVGEQDWALRQLAKVQHLKVVDAILKQTRNRDLNVRTAAVLQLGQQRALPGYAGKAVLEAMRRNAKDPTFLMAGLESVASLRYLGAKEMLAGLMKHHEYAVVKNALITIGALKDARFIEEIIKMMKKLRLEKGAKWDGVDVAVDTGTSGDADQKAAEAKGKAAEAKNKRKGKRSARSMRDLGPTVLQVMKELTDQEFTGATSARKWSSANKKLIEEAVKAVEAKDREQRARALALKKKK